MYIFIHTHADVYLDIYIHIYIYIHSLYIYIYRYIDRYIVRPRPVAFFGVGWGLHGGTDVHQAGILPCFS